MALVRQIRFGSVWGSCRFSLAPFSFVPLARNPCHPLRTRRGTYSHHTEAAPTAPIVCTASRRRVSLSERGGAGFSRFGHVESPALQFALRGLCGWPHRNNIVRFRKIVPLGDRSDLARFASVASRSRVWSALVRFGASRPGETVREVAPSLSDELRNHRLKRIGGGVTVAQTWRGSSPSSGVGRFNLQLARESRPCAPGDPRCRELAPTRLVVPLSIIRRTRTLAFEKIPGRFDSRSSKRPSFLFFVLRHACRGLRPPGAAAAGHSLAVKSAVVPLRSPYLRWPTCSSIRLARSTCSTT